MFCKLGSVVGGQAARLPIIRHDKRCACPTIIPCYRPGIAREFGVRQSSIGKRIRQTEFAAGRGIVRAVRACNVTPDRQSWRRSTDSGSIAREAALEYGDSVRQLATGEFTVR